MNETKPPEKKCSRCARTIEQCACCDDPECAGAAICNECLRLAVGQALAQPHTHGG